MAKPLIVAPDTTELRVALSRGKATLLPSAVTMVITRKTRSESCGARDCSSEAPPPPLLDCPPRLGDTAATVDHGWWGGCAVSPCDGIAVGQSYTTPSPRYGNGCGYVIDRTPEKIYTASAIVHGVAVFTLDEDLLDAPPGYYRAAINIEGHTISVLTMWVRASLDVARAVLAVSRFA